MADTPGEVTGMVDKAAMGTAVREVVVGRCSA